MFVTLVLTFYCEQSILLHQTKLILITCRLMISFCLYLKHCLGHEAIICGLCRNTLHHLFSVDALKMRGTMVGR